MPSLTSTPIIKGRYISLAPLFILAPLFLFAFPQGVYAATINWSATAATTAWATGSNWVGGVAPGSTDIASFDQTSYLHQPAAGTATVAGIIIGDGTTVTAALTISGTSLTIGSSGITVNTSAGNATISSPVVLSANQTFQTSGGSLTISGAITGTANLILNNNTSATGGVTLAFGSTVNNVGTITNSGTGTGTGSIAAAIGTNVTGIVENSSTSLLKASSGTSTCTAGNSIVSGTIWTTLSASLCSGTITIGTTTGSANATLQDDDSGTTDANPIFLASGNSGIDTIDSTFAGILSGGVTGTHNLILRDNGSNNLVFSTNPINNVGTITNSGSPGLVIISGGIGSNVTSVIENSTSSALTIQTTALTVNSGGTTLVNALGSRALTVSGGVTGTGNLILDNNSTLGAGITLTTTSVNNTGTITNSGTGSGNVTISASIGSNITGISTTGTSGLTISSAYPFAALGYTITNLGTGTYSLTGGVSGTGNLVLNEDPGSISIGGTINNTGTITNSGITGLGILTSVIGTNVTSITENSATSQLEFNSNSNAFSTNISILSGKISCGSVGGLGTGTITMGNTSGSANATVEDDDAASTASVPDSNPYVLASGNTGTDTIMDNDAGVFLSGGVTGTNNLVIGGTAGPITFETNPINISGTITNANTNSTQPTIISGGVSSNVTSIINNSGSSPLTIATSSIAVNASGTTFINNSTKAITVSSGVSGTGNLTLNNNSTLAAGITFTTNSVNNVGAVTNSGTGSGTVTIPGGVGSNVTTVTGNSTTSALTVSGALAVNSGGTTLVNAVATTALTVSGNITGTGNLVLNSNGSGGINLTGTSVNNVGTITNSGSSSGFDFIGAVIGTNVTGLVQNSSTSELGLQGANTFTTGTIIKSGTLENEGSVGTGTVTLGDTSGSANAVFEEDDSGTDANPIVLASGNSGTETVGAVFGGTLTGGITGTHNLVINCSGGGPLKFSTNPINNSGTITNSGSGGCAITVSGGVGSNVNTITQNSTVNTFTISSSSIAVNSGGTTLVNALGTKALTVSGGVTGTGNLILDNNSSLAAGITLTTTSLSNIGTITNSGTGTGSVTVTTGIGPNITNLIQNSSTSQLALSGGATPSGNVLISAGTLSQSARTLTLLGNFSNNGVFTDTGGTVMFASTTAAQTISGSSIPTFNNLTLNNSAGLTLNSSATVNGTLSFASGKITTGTNKISIGSAGSVLGAAAGQYVYGNLQRFIPNSSAPSATFDIGDATNYTPVTVAFSGTTSGSGSLTASVIGTDHPNIHSAPLNASHSVNRYWTITNNGVAGFSSYSATFTFVAGDVDSGANTANFIVGKYDSPVWSLPTVGTLTSLSTQAIGMTSFSDYQIAEAATPFAQSSTSQTKVLGGNIRIAGGSVRIQ